MGILSAMYAEPPRKGVSFSPTITRTGTSIAGNDSMTEPSCCLRMLSAVPRPSLRFGAGLLGGEPLHLLVDEPVPAGTGRVVAVAGTGVEQDQALDAVRVGDAKRKREVAAERMTADDRTIGADVVEQRGHVPEHARDGVRLGVCACVRAPVATQVPGDETTAGIHDRGGIASEGRHRSTRSRA